MPFDSVVSIGGQSLLDGLWRILQPALQSLANPLPVTIPGMTNAWVRIRSITPSLSSSDPASLVLDVNVEARGDILLTASVKAGLVHVALPNANITIPPEGTAAPQVHLPTPISVTLPDMTETLPLPAGVTRQITLHTEEHGTIALPPPGTFNLPTLRGILEFVQGTLGEVGLPLPSVVPLAVNLTPGSPVTTVRVTLPLGDVSPINLTSAFGLLLVLGGPTISSITDFPNVAFFESAISTGLRHLLLQLGVPLPDPGGSIGSVAEPFAGVGPTVAEIHTMAANITAAVRRGIQEVLKDALTGITARTGRLIFPMPADGSPCDLALLPTRADPRVFVSAANASTGSVSSPVLQIYFSRPGVTDFSATDFYDFAPTIVPSRPTEPSKDVEIKIGNDFLRELLCCLVEKLPNFTFHGAATPPASPMPDRNCCNWSGVTLELWPIVLSGTLFLCIVGPSGMGTPPKSIELVGDFVQDNSLGRIGVKFTLTLELHLNDFAAVTGLRLATATTEPIVTLDGGLVALLTGAGVISLLVPGMLVLLIALPLILRAFVQQQLFAVIDTLLSRAHALTSPVAVPPAIFEAFGRFVPVSLEIDDLTATGVLATPTTPWALLPISAKPAGHPDPGGGNQPPLTQLTAEVVGSAKAPQ